MIDITQQRFDVIIKGFGIHVNRLDVTYYDAYKIVEETAAEHPENDFLVEFWSEHKEAFGFVFHKVDGFEIVIRETLGNDQPDGPAVIVTDPSQNKSLDYDTDNFPAAE